MTSRRPADVISVGHDPSRAGNNSGEVSESGDHFSKQNGPKTRKLLPSLKAAIHRTLKR